MTVTLVRLSRGRQALRVVDDQGRHTLLAVPPIDPRVSRSTRRQVYELVLRRQPGLAHTVEQIEVEVIESRERHHARLGQMLAERPHATSRDHGLAA